MTANGGQIERRPSFSRPALLGTEPGRVSTVLVLCRFLRQSTGDVDLMAPTGKMAPTPLRTDLALAHPEKEKIMVAKRAPPAHIRRTEAAEGEPNPEDKPPHHPAPQPDS